MDEINKVKAQIEELENREKAGERSKELDARMVETLKRLNLLMEQKGIFASPVSIGPFLFLSITYFAHSLSTSLLHPSSVGKVAR